MQTTESGREGHLKGKRIAKLITELLKYRFLNPNQTSNEALSPKNERAVIKSMSYINPQIGFSRRIFSEISHIIVGIGMSSIKYNIYRLEKNIADQIKYPSRSKGREDTFIHFRKNDLIEKGKYIKSFVDTKIDKESTKKYKKPKKGKSTLTGNAGEHYVMAELLRRGIIAGLTPRNTPDYDILATKGEKTVKIRVKTKSSEVNIWQYSVRKKELDPLKNIEGNDFTVLVDLMEKNEKPEFYIIPSSEVNKVLKEDFDKWVNTPGPIKKQRSPDNPKRHIDKRERAAWLNNYKEKWENLFK